MKAPLQIGITGGIGSGKSLVCKIFNCLGTPIYDADSGAKRLMNTDAVLIQNIKNDFGTLAYNDDGSLNRTYISQQVFNKADKLKQLNSLVHPRVQIDYEQWIERHHEFSYVIKEAALLFETKSNTKLDKIVMIYSPEPLRINRVLLRDAHRTKEQVLAIINNQMPDEDKKKNSDFVIVNDEVELIIPQVIKLHNLFTNHFKDIQYN